MVTLPVWPSLIFVSDGRCHYDDCDVIVIDAIELGLLLQFYQADRLIELEVSFLIMLLTVVWKGNWATL